MEMHAEHLKIWIWIYVLYEKIKMFIHAEATGDEDALKKR
jgi:hypothetical protein